MPIPYVFTDNETASADQVNANFTYVLSQVGGSWPANIDGSAINFYNFIAFGADGTVTNDDTALTNMFAAMNALNGGIGGGYAWFPTGTYMVNAGNFDGPDQAILQGAGCSAGGGSGTTLFSIQTSGTFLNFTGAHTFGGTALKELAFGFIGGAQTSNSIAVVAGQTGIHAIRCTFLNCPMAFRAESLSSGLLQCNIQYHGISGGVGPTNALAMVHLGAPQTFVIGPGEFLQTPVNMGGPTGICGISMSDQTPLEHGQIDNLHISDFDYSISYAIHAGQSQYDHIRAVEMNANVTPVYMQPAASNYSIQGERYTDCLIKLGNHSSSISPLFYIDTNGGANSNIDDIQISNCTMYQSNWHALQINSGQNIACIGGRISGNGPSGGAGVAITGSVGDVSIIGVNICSTYPLAANVQAQQYALLVSGTSISGVLRVADCDMTGYSGPPVSVTGSFTGAGYLYITGCAGYNDQNSTVTNTAPTGSPSSASAHGYYGPSVVTFSNASAINVTVNGVTVSASSGSYYLEYPSNTILFGSTPSTFSWIGK